MECKHKETITTEYILNGVFRLPHDCVHEVCKVCRATVYARCTPGELEIDG